LSTRELALRSVGSILGFTAETLSITSGNGKARVGRLRSTLDPTRAELAVGGTASSSISVDGVAVGAGIALLIDLGITSDALVDAISAT